MVTEKLNWTSVTLKEVIERGKRLEAGAFNLVRKHAQDIVNACAYDCVTLDSPKLGFVAAFFGDRSKRNYVSQSESSIGFLGSSEMLDIDPNPVKFVNENNPIVEKLTLQEKTVLISR